MESTIEMSALFCMVLCGSHGPNEMRLWAGFDPQALCLIHVPYASF